MKAFKSCRISPSHRPPDSCSSRLYQCLIAVSQLGAHGMGGWEVMENCSSMDFKCAEKQHRNHVELVGPDRLQMARALACWKTMPFAAPWETTQHGNACFFRDGDPCMRMCVVGSFRLPPPPHRLVERWWKTVAPWISSVLKSSIETMLSWLAQIDYKWHRLWRVGKQCPLQLREKPHSTVMHIYIYIYVWTRLNPHIAICMLDAHNS